MTQQTQPDSEQAAYPALRFGVVLALWLWAFWPEVSRAAGYAASDSNWSHAWAAPVLAGALCIRRRVELHRSLTRGSWVGLLALLASVGVFASAIWPLGFGYLADVGAVMTLAAALWAVGGRRFFNRCSPVILIVLLSFPIGQRMYASLIIRPETYTMAASRAVLDTIPGVEVTLDGPDLHFVRGERTGTIALGASNRGAALLVTYAVVGVFVAFSRIRPLWALALMGLAAGPVVLAANLLRMLTWGVVTMYGSAGPVSPGPRIVASIVSLLLAWAVFLVIAGALDRLDSLRTAAQADAASSESERDDEE
jgi:hypothetical protein